MQLNKSHCCINASTNRLPETPCCWRIVLRILLPSVCPVLSETTQPSWGCRPAMVMIQPWPCAMCSSETHLKMTSPWSHLSCVSVLTITWPYQHPDLAEKFSSAIDPALLSMVLLRTVCTTRLCAIWESKGDPKFKLLGKCVWFVVNLKVMRLFISVFCVEVKAKMLECFNQSRKYLGTCRMWKQYSAPCKPM